VERAPGLSFIFIIVIALASVALSQEFPAHPKADRKICVAVVSNMSGHVAVTTRLTDRLSKDLRDVKIKAVSMDSSTTMERRLHLTPDNGEEAKSKGCDYIVLTQIMDLRMNSAEPQSARITVGRKGSNVDPSDASSSASSESNREDLQIDFALFPTDRVESAMDAAVAGPFGNAPDDLMSAMDRESNRISHELKKK
jgi:hypothetical protein